MKLNQIAVIASCLVFIAGCSREPADQGGTAQNSPSDTGSATSSPSLRNRGDTERVNPAAPDATPATPTPGSLSDNTAKQADNTGRNVRDRSDATVTPEDQSQAKDDVELTRRIRKAVTDNNELSTNAKNIKIIDSGNGKITLRGPVNSADEQEKILNLTKGIDGVQSIDNQLEVKSNQ